MPEPARLPRPGLVEVERERVVLLERIRRLSLTADMATDNDRRRKISELREAHAEYHRRFQLRG